MNLEEKQLTVDQTLYVQDHLGLDLNIADGVLRLAFNCQVHRATSVYGSKACVCGKHKQSDVFTLIPTIASLGVLVLIYTRAPNAFKRYEGLVVLINPSACKKVAPTRSARSALQ